MSEPQTPASQMRMERINQLLRELEYEVTRGMLERQIDETITYRFYVPNSRAIPRGIVGCEFHMRPMTDIDALLFNRRDYEARLKLVKNDGQ